MFKFLIKKRHKVAKAQRHKDVNDKKRAFTLLELLVAIGVITLLASMLLPALSKAKDKAKYARWLGYKNNLRCDPNLVAYYDFEDLNEGETSLTTLKNKSQGPSGLSGHLHYKPEGMDGEIISATWVRNGGRWIGKDTLEFDGSFSYINCGNDSSLNITDAITAAAWVKLDVSSGTQVITRRGGTINWLLRRDAATNKWNFYLHANGNKEISGTTTPVAGIWYYVVGTYKDGDGLKIYVNGILEGTNATATGVISTDTNDMYIGQNGIGSSWFNGSIDEVAIYDRALTAKEIENHYKMGRR